MPLNLGSLVDKLFGGKTVVDSIGGIIDKYHVSPEDKRLMQEAEDKAMEEKRAFALQLLQNDAADTASARDMNAKVQGDKPSWLAKNVGYIIDIFVLLLWGSYTLLITLHMLKLIQVVDKSVDFTVIVTLWGAVTALAQQIIGFHRGSSQGSVEKQKMIDKLTS